MTSFVIDSEIADRFLQASILIMLSAFLEALSVFFGTSSGGFVANAGFEGKGPCIRSEVNKGQNVKQVNICTV